MLTKANLKTGGNVQSEIPFGVRPIKWPVIARPRVFHVGELTQAPDAQDAQRQFKGGESLEGNGLSVSLHPAAWRHIARLGGQSTWALTAPDLDGQKGKGLFLDTLALKARHLGAITSWAAGQGLIESAETIEVSWIDCESDERVFMVFDGLNPVQVKAAQDEFDFCENEAPRIKKRSAFKATPALNERIGFKVDIHLARDMAMTLFVEDVLYASHDLQGCWWTETLDKYALSAPRGVIHCQAQTAWGRAVVDGDYDEDESVQQENCS